MIEVADEGPPGTCPVAASRPSRDRDDWELVGDQRKDMYVYSRVRTT
jgi:hypothetical protein